ncbi:arginine repressor [Vitiosangium sp. GDMCC 1.1324]|uniref:arginine repressor n=1 Tax=Vitiosangium sp. (strain GDMCC 1.1324) TaxID=2138576 RepID=UPI000D397FAE|nr:arginine repressor [Vitiosangium sp. GDMCC 1.1324]PTL85970.1 arginine repressor [Vitiosangium sp. GDMCC 1.1324]
MKNNGDKAARQEAIRRIIRAHAVSTQEELGQLLAREGFDVTQATLSRDLAQLGAMRVSLPEGGTVYGLGDAPPPTGEDRLRELGEMILSVDDNELLVVLRTRPGSAPVVASAIDHARLLESLGTIAGDDTIFAAPARGKSARTLSRKLKSLFGKEETP